MRLRTLIVAALCMARVAWAGAPATNAGFNPGVNGTVRAVAAQSDGKLLLGGDFSQVGGLERSRMARLFADGTTDTTFRADADGAVLAILPQGGGKKLVAGEFHSINGQGRNHIARINSDGSVDASFAPGEGPNGAVNAVAAQADGKALIGGSFTEFNGTARVAVARLNANGSLDTSFNPADTGTNSSVNAIAVQRDGKIVLGGYFERVGGKIHNRVVRLNADGTVDDNFNPGTDANSYVNALIIQPDGRMVIGGTFVAVNGVYRRAVARINENGSLDATFDPGEAADNFVYALALQADGKVIVGGGFSTMGGEARRGIARLNVDGSVDPGFRADVGENGSVYAVAVQPDGNALMGGDFTSVSGTGRNRLARILEAGALEVAFSKPSRFYPLALQDDGKILGSATDASMAFVSNKLNRANPDGTPDVEFINHAASNTMAGVIAIQPDGKMIVTGSTLKKILRLNADGTTDTTFQIGTITGSGVRVLALQPDGKILAGGEIDSFNGVTIKKLIRLNPDGTLDPSFNTGSETPRCITIALQRDGKILVSGGTADNGCGLIRLNSDGSLDTGFSQSYPSGGPIYCFAIQPDGKILAAGQFDSMRNVSCFGIMRLHENGRRDPSFDLNQSYLNFNTGGSIALQADGKIIFKGMHQWSSQGFNWYYYTVRLNADGTQDTQFGYIREFEGGMGLLLQPDGKMLVTNGHPCDTLRYTNPDAATQKLVVNSSTVTWALGGSYPVPNMVNFEESGDGEHWTSLGWGEAVAGVGFRLTGLKLPANKNHYVRATGYYQGNFRNANTWLLRSTARYYDHVQGAAGSEWLLAE
ncbi:MAG: hypothetical protein ABFD69_16445 [Candidatus Sumerlaeia bacterium]